MAHLAHTSRAGFALLLGLTLAFLTACGGGGDSGPAAGSAALSPASVMARVVMPPRPLVAQPASLVNSTTAGEQQVQSVGTLMDGGYAVAWTSGSTLSVQHYDSAGTKAGGEVQMLAGGANSTMTVLADGNVLIAYPFFRTEPLAFPDWPVITQVSGVYLQRFDASGAQVLPPTEVVLGTRDINTRITTSPSISWSGVGRLRLLALADGGFVIGWSESTSVGPGWGQNEMDQPFGTFFSNVYQRYDSQAQKLGDAISLKVSSIEDDCRLEADAQGGYTVYCYQGSQPGRLVSVTHHDAGDTARTIVAPRTGDAVLLPLEGGRYLLFENDAQGAARQQWLDGEGNRLGTPEAIAALPVFAKELADGSYVVFWSAAGGTTAQRFASDGTPLGEPFSSGPVSAAAHAAALADGGLALAWSAAGAAGDQDIYTQRFTPAPEENHQQAAKARQAKRKACQESAKDFKGAERKQFMDACLAAG